MSNTNNKHKSPWPGLAVLCLAGSLAAFPVGAEPPGDRGNGGHGNKEHKEHKEHKGGGPDRRESGKSDVRIEYREGDSYRYESKVKHKGYKKAFSGGPPPWAPAWGRRNGAPAAYYGPQGVDIGLLAGGCNREAVGGLLGGMIGGAAGSRIGEGTGKTAATIAGTLLGIAVGGNIGRSMDQADRYCTGQILEQVPDRAPVIWRNPDAQAEYRVTPMGTYEREGRYCREYSTQVVVGGRTQSLYGTACRQPDGSWEVVE